MQHIKTCIVSELCPDVVQTPTGMLIDNVRYALDVGPITPYGRQWRCEHRIFDTKPTEEYYQELIQQDIDFTAHVDWIDGLLNRLLLKAATPATRTVQVEQKVLCKYCGHDKFIDCHTHYTCRKCAVVRDKIYAGPAYREMKNRVSDMNGIGRHNNPLFSAGFASLTEARGPGSESINRILKQHMGMSQRDRELCSIKELMEDTCERIRLPQLVNRAFSLYCTLRNQRLENKKAVAAACLFYSLTFN